MELRLLTLALQLLDPRAWRRRLLQLGGGVFAFVLVWVRAVRAIDGVRQRRAERHMARDRTITTRQRASERRGIDESIDSLT
ncbi:MAG: hypothetical protein ABI200_01825 [Gaiellales bacterium]